MLGYLYWVTGDSKTGRRINPGGVTDLDDDVETTTREQSMTQECDDMDVNDDHS